MKNIPRGTEPALWAADRRARRWDVFVTVLLAAFLLVPVPFVQFRSWPERRLILERPVLPWSTFRLCYHPIEGGPPVEELYRFQGSGRLSPQPLSAVSPVALESSELPFLQWQKQPEIGLHEIHRTGALLEITVRWQPVLAYPMRMLKDAWKAHPLGSQGGGANR